MPTRLLYLTILIEGYVVLAVELLAIRQLLPFAGSGVEVVAIAISGVLLPLAIGYHYGGIAYARAFARARRRGTRPPSIRRILQLNIVIALLILTFGLSYPVLEDFFGFLTNHGVRHRLAQTSAYTTIFLVLPVFLLGQTVPLISRYFSRRRLSEITGRMLFFSTTGAFFGSVFSTLVLMSFIGVHNTVIVTLGMLAALAVMLGGKGRRRGAAAAIALFLLAVILNCGIGLRAVGVVSDNAYNIARVIPLPEEDAKILMLNRSPSSEIGHDPEQRADYIKYIEKSFIATMPPATGPRDILVIGAGGFTLGVNDTFNHYIFVDIDPAMKDIAEQHFLPEKLTPNKQFVASSARAFLRRDDKHYDLIVLDAFQNAYAIPMECTTREFLQDVKARLKPNGVVAANIFASPDFRDKFSARYDRTFGSVFPIHARHAIEEFDPWRQEDATDPAHYLANVIYVYFNTPLAGDDTIYTDDKNTYSIDRP